MALLLHLSAPSPPLMLISSTSFSSRLRWKCIDLQPKCITAIQFCAPFGVTQQQRTAGIVVVRASSDVDGVEQAGGEVKEEEAVVAVEKLPLESKLQEKLEQKERMKMAKKIRLRRKRLVRKRRMRKKGRWPPSKMKKNKNV